MIGDRERLAAVDPTGRRALGLDAVQAAIAAVEPATATRRVLEPHAAELVGCTLFAVGKAARAMALGALSVCEPRAGIVVALDAAPLAPLTVRVAPHPLPDESTGRAGLEVIEAARALGDQDVALFLLSGGASAMLELPKAGVSLRALRETTAALLASGAPIEEVNAVRRRLSQLKGGRLAEALRPARVVTVLLSDVPGGAPSVVGSGPTLPPPTGPDALEVVRARDLLESLPEQVVRVLRAPDAPVDPAAFDGELTLVAADNVTAQRAAVRALCARGLRCTHATDFLRGEARVVGRELAARAPASEADALVWGGETTVRVIGGGRGGRNQELALGALEEIGDHVLLAVGTDGVDGTSGAAGALVDGLVVQRAEQMGWSAEAFLADNDAARFFELTDTAIRTGPTGTNVADLCVWIR